MSVLQQTLEISGISLVLLFGAMALIWGLMALMGKFPVKKEEEIAEEVEEAPEETAAPVISSGGKVKAAAAAVAAALAIGTRASRLSSKPGGTSTTPWQAAQRAEHISRRNQVISRKRG